MTENNKVVYNGQTLIDLTQDDVTASDVRSGVYFHDSAGVRGQGTLASTSVPTADTIAEWDSDVHMNSEDMTSQEVDDFVDGLNVSGINAVDYVVEQGTNSGWTYTKWNSGKMEAWLHNYSAGSFTGSVWISPVRYYDTTVAIPSGLFNSAPNTIATSGTNQWWIVNFVASSKTSISMRIATLASSATAMYLNAYAYGTWK